MTKLLIHILDDTTSIDTELTGIVDAGDDTCTVPFSNQANAVDCLRILIREIERISKETPR